MDKKIAKHIRLKQEIKTWIENGKLRSGDLLPSENDIAQLFQVSRQTVRQALGGLEQEGLLSRHQGKGTYVSEPTIQNEAETAKLPDKQQIGVLTTYISDYIFPHIVRGIESELRRHGYGLVLSSTDNDKERERESLEMLLREPLSGLIVEPTRSALGNQNFSYYASLDYKGIPYLMINETYPELNCPYVKLDDELGGFLATEHLLQLGHRNIAGFFKTDDMQGAQRLKGFLRAHHTQRIPLRPELIVQYKTEEAEHTPHQIAMHLLSKSEVRPTAFVCYNDELAVRLLDTARSLGLSVPSQLSIVGFDDSFLATATEVKLTTLAHPKAAMGEVAAKLLIRMIKQRQGNHAKDGVGDQADIPIEPIVFKPELIVRESSAPPISK